MEAMAGDGAKGSSFGRLTGLGSTLGILAESPSSIAKPLSSDSSDERPQNPTSQLSDTVAMAKPLITHRIGKTTSPTSRIPMAVNPSPGVNKIRNARIFARSIFDARALCSEFSIVSVGLTIKWPVYAFSDT